ncbi:MAG: DUF262 domain-containing protein [Hyphomonadaceae bacterium]
MSPPFEDRPGEPSRKRVTDFFGAQPGGLRSEVLNLAGLLSREAPLMVPRYQRPYTWTEEEVGKLIQDLRRAWEREGSYYFIGHFVLVRTEKNEWQIADGQQRIATMTMILAYIRERLQNRGEFFQALILGAGGKPRVRLRQIDAPFYYEYVQTPGNFYDLPKIEGVRNDAQACLCQAAEVICEGLADMNDVELERFAKFVCRAALFDVIEADEPGGAAIVFTTVNDRGRDLSAADLMKSALLDRAQMSEEEKDAAATVWEELEDRLNRKTFGELLELTPQMFAGETILAPGDLGAFVQSLHQHVGVEKFLRDWLPRHGQALFEIKNECVGGAHGGEINRRIGSLKLLRDQSWLPLAVSFLANHADDDEKTRQFFRGLDLIAFSVLLTAVRPETLPRRWKRARAAQGDEKKLFSPTDGALTLRDAERRALIERLGKPFKRDQKKDADKRRILLMRINACLEDGEALTREHDLTVEHILPVKGGPAWEAAFAEDLLDCAHLIGNWTLITFDQNQRCGAAGFAAKKTIFFEPQSPTWAVTRTLADVDEWNPVKIQQRREKFVGALFKDWGLAGS